jgi:hypothetical protein
MVFVYVCRALYDFTPEEADAKEQLAFAEGDILFITDKSGVDEEGQTSEESNDWWVAKHSETEASGDVPISYVEELTPIGKGIALYDYEAQTEDEIDLIEDESINIVYKIDNDWWIIEKNKQYGQCPASYIQEDGVELEQQNEEAVQEVEEPEAVVEEIVDEEASKVNAQNFKNALLAAAEESLSGPSNISYYDVTEIEKKKGKEIRKGKLGVNSDNIYLCDSEKKIIQQWELNSLKFFKNKKSKKLVLNFGIEVHEFEGTKTNIDALAKEIIDSQMKSKIRPTNTTNAAAEAISTLANKVVPEPVEQVQVTEEAEEEEEEEQEQEVGPPKIAKVLYDYEANIEGDVTVHENDNVIILDDSDPEWWKVRVVSKNGKEGMVPKTYIEVMVPGQGNEEEEEEEEVYDETQAQPNLPPRIPPAPVSTDVPPVLPDRDTIQSPPALPQRPNMGIII